MVYEIRKTQYYRGQNILIYSKIKRIKSYQAFQELKQKVLEKHELLPYGKVRGAYPFFIYNYNLKDDNGFTCSNIEFKGEKIDDVKKLVPNAYW